MFFKRILFILLLCRLHLSAVSIHPKPIATATNPYAQYSLVNSVHFHPKKNLFCVTYSHCNKVVLYKVDASGALELFQILSNPEAQFSEPQHAAFSPDGKKMIVANWTNQTLTIYKCEESGLCGKTPVAVIPAQSILAHHKPHGIAFSPCGNLLAISYGAESYHKRAIALFCLTEMDCELTSFVETTAIPKGITFSPDGSCILVTFSDANSLAIFNLDRQNQIILPIPRQIIQGVESKISHPEDVKISPDGSYCAITNSDRNTVTFYPFDPRSNWITRSTPICVLQNPLSHLFFPHGLAFSADGFFLAITQFGPISLTREGDIIWSKKMRADQAKINLYKIVNE